MGRKFIQPLEGIWWSIKICLVLSVSEKVLLLSAILIVPSHLWKMIIIFFYPGTCQSITHFQPSVDYLIQIQKLS